MTTSLASQLQKLQQRPSDDKKLAHSFLFTNTDAKQFSREQIYELCLTGLQTLTSIDNRLHPFMATLFDRTTIRRERVLLTKAEQSAANKAIDHFLALLSPHLFLTAAQQVFEYLVRVWEVQTFNAQSVLEAFLPFHDHAIFARAVMLLDLRDTGFEMLSQNQLSGAPLLGSQLRELCGESRKVLRTLCRVATNAFRFGVNNNAAFSLFAGVCCSLASHQDGEALFRVILPVLDELISGHRSGESLEGDVADYSHNSALPVDVKVAREESVRRESLATALVVVCSWCNEVILGIKVLRSVVKLLVAIMLRSDLPIPIADALGVLGVVFRTQSATVAEPSFANVLHSMLSFPWRLWAPVIPGGTAELVSALVRECAGMLALAQSIESCNSEAVNFLEVAADKLPLRECDLYIIVLTISSNANLHDAFLYDATRNECSRLLLSLERRYSVVFDIVMVRLLKCADAFTPQPKATFDNEEEGAQMNSGEAAGTLSAERKAAISSFLQKHFSASSSEGSAHHRLIQVSEGGRRGGEKSRRSLPLSMCLLHPTPEVRLLAVREMQIVQSLFSHGTTGHLVDLFLHMLRFETSLETATAAMELAFTWVAGGDDVPEVVVADVCAALWELVCAHLSAATPGTEPALQFARHCAEALVGSEVSPALPRMIYFLGLLHETAVQLNLSTVAAEASKAIQLRVTSFATSSPAIASPACLSTSVTTNKELHRFVKALAAERIDTILTSLNTDLQRKEHHIAHSIEVSFVAAVMASGAVDAVSAATAMWRLVSYFGNDDGYMARLRREEQERSVKALEEGSVAKGRGAKTLSGSVGSRVTNSVTALLVESVRQSATYGFTSDGGITEPVAVGILSLISVLGGPLPAVALAPAVLGRALMTAIGTAPAGHVRNAWLQATRDAILAVVEAKSHPGEDVSPAAALIFATLPMCTADDDRTALLQAIQDVVTTHMSAGGRSSASKGRNAIHIVVHELVAQQRAVSVTALNSLVETASLGAKAAPISLDAANLLSRWFKDGNVPLSLFPDLMTSFFPRAVGTTGKLNERRSENLDALLKIAIPLLSEWLAAASAQKKSMDADRIRCIQALLPSLALHRAKSADAMEVSFALNVLATGCVVNQSTGKVEALYPFVLDALSIAMMSEGDGAADAQSNPKIFSLAKATKQQQQSKTPQLSLAATFATPMMTLWERYGTDAATFLGTTVGGYNKVFLGTLLASTSPMTSELMQLVSDVLDARLQSNNNAEKLWSAPDGSQLKSVMSAYDAFSIASKAVAALAPETNSPEAATLFSAVMRVLTMIVKFAPSLQFDDDDEDSDHQTPSCCHSLREFVEELLSTIPLARFASVFKPANASTPASKSTTVVYAGKTFTGQATQIHSVLAFIESIVTSLTHSALSGCAALRHSVTKHSLELIAALLLDEESASSVSTVCIADLLKVVAPVLTVARRNTDATTSGVDDGEATFLHVPLLALMIRLESIELTESLHFRSASELCRQVVVSFDIGTQMKCLAGVLHTLTHPENPLGDAGTADEETTHIASKLLKPNKIINRQELILAFVVTTLKCDEFLEPFIAQQQSRNRDGGAEKWKKKPTTKPAEVEDTTEGTIAETHTMHSTCMHLLLTCLATFSHYHSLNASIPAEPSEGDEDTTEAKAFAVLMELLAGNGLACVLAGINEPTFVECQRRLLNDSRVTMQEKGLETLLDRLHQSLPTIENVMTEAEAAQRRRDVKDPKKKLSNSDLLVLKARPLTTKRTFQLFPFLSTIARSAVNGIKSKTTLQSSSQTSMQQLVTVAQLSVSCIEEVIRIVGNGGSLLAEQNLARAESLDNSEIQRLFGSKAKVNEILSILEMFLHTVNGACASKATVAAAAGTASIAAMLPSEHQAAREVATGLWAEPDEGALLTLASIATAISTIVQTLGVGCVAHISHEILRSLAIVSRFSVTSPATDAHPAAGALLRHAALNATIRSFSATWLMSHPFIPVLLSVTTHDKNVNDPDTAHLATELLEMMVALLEPRVLLESCCTAFAGASPIIHSATHSLVILFGCIDGLLGKLTKNDLNVMPLLVSGEEKDSNFWISALCCLSSAHSLPSVESMHAVFDAYLTFFIKFKSQQCTKFFAALVTWAFADLKQLQQDPAHAGNKRTLQQVIVFLSLYNRMLEKLGPLSDFTFPVATNALVSLLAAYSPKQSRLSEAEAGQQQPTRKSAVSSLITLLLEAALTAIRLMGTAQLPSTDADRIIPQEVYFANAEVFNALMPSLVLQLANTTFLADDAMDYDQRVGTAVIPAIRSFVKALSSAKLWSKVQSEILKQLRSTNWRVRKASLATFRGMYLDGGDEMCATIMSEMLPAVVEATEDTRDEVVEEARLLCNDLSAITGNDVLHAMSS